MKKVSRINYGEIHDMLANQMAEIYDNKLKGDELKVEIKKAHTMATLASSIINLGKLQLQGAKQYGIDEENEKLYIDQKNND